jgi:hypothetical protein
MREGREIIVELDRLRSMIVANIGVQNPRLALDLLWELMELHPSILELVDDSRGYAGDVFTTACCDLDPWRNEQTSIRMRWLGWCFRRSLTTTTEYMTV